MHAVLKLSEKPESKLYISPEGKNGIIDCQSRDAAVANCFDLVVMHESHLLGVTARNRATRAQANCLQNALRQQPQL